MSQQTFYSSRSRALQHQTCPRSRYWLSERGFELIRQSIPLATGSATHLVFRRLLEGLAPEKAIQCGLDWYSAICMGRGLQLDRLEDESRIFAEQNALVEAFGWLSHLRVIPKLLETYEVLEVEEMDEALLYEDPQIKIIWRSIPDGLLRRREDGELYLLSLKTCAEYGKNKELEARVDMQGLSEAWSWENSTKRYGTQAMDVEIRGVQMLYLVKGRKIDVAGQDSSQPTKSWRTNSPLIYAYHDKSFPPNLAWSRMWTCSAPHPMRKGECPGGKNHKRSDDWESKLVTEFSSVKEWMEALHEGRITPEAGDPLEPLWYLPVPNYRTPEASRSWHRQIQAQEVQVAKDLVQISECDDAFFQDALDELFQQRTQNCLKWRSKCPAWEICWGPGHVAADPVASGLYQIRQGYLATVEEDEDA